MKRYWELTTCMLMSAAFTMLGAAWGKLGMGASRKGEMLTWL